MSRCSRRKFLGTLTASASVTMVGGSFVNAVPVGERKIRFAQIGCGRRGRRLAPMWHDNDFVAAVDTDRAVVDSFNPNRFPDLRRYSDYREMYAKHMDDIDAVIVSTPDHTHFAAAMPALLAGKAVYCEKPLAWSMRECFDLADTAQRMGVPTQMGNQGSGTAGWRQAYSMVHGGVIGDIKEVHTWTNRPVWTQGLERPEGEHPIPDTLDWESWVGPAEMAPYLHRWPSGTSRYNHHVYTPAGWRGWYDFGCGALGDMACHTMNVVFKTMKPSYDFTVEPVLAEGRSKSQFPAKQIIKWEFAKTQDRPAFDAYWYDGGHRPERPDEMGGQGLPERGTMFRGAKGVIVTRGDFNEANTVYIGGEIVNPEYEMLVAEAQDIKGEFLSAVRGEIEWDETVSNFMYSGKMSAIIAAGIISERRDKKLKFSAETMRFDDEQAGALMKRTPRAGWEDSYDI